MFRVPLDHLIAKDAYSRKIDLLDLTGVAGYFTLKIQDDHEYGGLSEGAIEWTENGVEFRGHVDTERMLKMMYPPHMEFYQQPFWKALAVKQNLVRIEIRRLPIPAEVEPEDDQRPLPVMIKLGVVVEDDIESVQLYVCHLKT